MTAHHVLGVLEADERRQWAAFSCAVELAEAEQARLTLAMTTDPGWLLRWFAPAALQSTALSPDDLDFRMIASRRLARTAEYVPAGIPLTTLVLGQSTSGALAELLRRGRYDALVVTDVLLAHCRRVRREVRRLGLRTVMPARPSPPLTSTLWPAQERPWSTSRARGTRTHRG